MKTPLTLTTLAIAGALFAGALLAGPMVGCQSPPRVQPTQAISADRLEQLRTEFMAADAGARVGSVDAVLESGMYLTVGQINVSDFPENTAVAIIDSNKNVVAYGTVVRTFENSVHVKYELSGKRPPQVGDAAVKFTEKF